MSDFDLTGELSLKSELHMLRPITEKVHSGNGPVSLVHWELGHSLLPIILNKSLVQAIAGKKINHRR